MEQHVGVVIRQGHDQRSCQLHPPFVKKRPVFVVVRTEKKISGRGGVSFSQQLIRRTPLPLRQQVPQLLCFLIVHLRTQEPTTISRRLRRRANAFRAPMLQIRDSPKAIPASLTVSIAVIFWTAILRTFVTCTR